MFSLCLFFCLLATLLKKFLTDFDEIFRIARQWQKEQLIKFGGDPRRQCRMGVMNITKKGVVLIMKAKWSK